MPRSIIGLMIRATIRKRETNRKIEAYREQFRHTVEKPKDMFLFPIDLPQSKYAELCQNVAKRFREIIDVQVYGHRVTCLVKRKIMSPWKFFYEFSFDGGGTLEKELKTSKIPENYVAVLSKRIKTFRSDYSKGWLINECPNCKGKMLQDPKSRKWGCISCGYELNANERITAQNDDILNCGKCGSRLVSRYSSSEKATSYYCEKCKIRYVFSPSVQEKQQSNSGITHYCPYCGVYVESANAKFCQNCGKRL